MRDPREMSDKQLHRAVCLCGGYFPKLTNAYLDELDRRRAGGMSNPQKLVRSAIPLPWLKANATNNGLS
jgi:hypothetical protein